MNNCINSSTQILGALALMLLWGILPVVGAEAETPLADRLLDRGRQEVTLLRFRAALADRKDIRARYIRVRQEGRVVTLAGFVKDAGQASAAERIVRHIAPEAEVLGFWSFEPDLDERDA